MRTTRTVSLAAAAVVTAVATWSLAQAEDASAGGGELTFFIHDTKQAIVDAPPKGSSQGDLFVAHGLVYTAKGGKKIGRFGATCVKFAAAGTPADSSCSVDYVLPGGQLHTEIFGAAAILVSGKPFSFSVLGGTGSYRNARGEGTMRVPPNVKDHADAYVRIELTG